MTAAPIKPLGYTMVEAAQRLRISRRNLQELVKDHPFYYANGHRKLFTEDDISALIEAMRPKVEPRIRAGTRLSSRFSGRINPVTLAEAQRIFAKKKSR